MRRVFLLMVDIVWTRVCCVCWYFLHAAYTSGLAVHIGEWRFSSYPLFRENITILSNFAVLFHWSNGSTLTMLRMLQPTFVILGQRHLDMFVFYALLLIHLNIDLGVYLLR